MGEHLSGHVSVDGIGTTVYGGRMSNLIANRQAKAQRLAVVLRTHDATAADARAMPESGWSMVADLAGTKPPSVETQQTVVAILTEAERTDDPFASFKMDAS
jgi:hypothetical protein